MKKWLLIVCGAAVLAVAAVLTHGFGLCGNATSTALTLYGNVDIRTVDLGFRVSGRIADMPIEEGSPVKAGALLAQLDLRPLNDALKSAEAQVRAASAEVDKRRSGNRPQDIAQAQAVLAERRALLDEAQQDFTRHSELVDTGAISRAAFDASQARYRSAQAQLETAQQALSLQRAGARSEDIAAAVAQQAVAAAQLDKVQTDIDDATIVAPAAGTILTRAREPGAIVQSGETVFTLAIERPMRVRAYIPEPDMGRISPDMEVLVRSDGNPTAYHGTIGFISPVAEFTPKSVQTESLRTDLVYRLRIIVSDPDDSLRQGQPVTIDIPAARPLGQR